MQTAIEAKEKNIKRFALPIVLSLAPHHNLDLQLAYIKRREARKGNERIKILNTTELQKFPRRTEIKNDYKYESSTHIRQTRRILCDSTAGKRLFMKEIRRFRYKMLWRDYVDWIIVYST